MLLRFRFSNFRSFRDEQTLSMVAGPLHEGDDDLITVPGFEHKLLPVAAIYGANASGKTNVLRALQFMRNAVLMSFSDWRPEGPIPRTAFKLAKRSTDVPSQFEIDFLVEGRRFQYGFALSDEAVVNEWLNSYPKGKRQRLYTRDRDNSFVFGPSLSGNNKVIEGITRRNGLFLSAAAHAGHVRLKPIYDWFLQIVATLNRGASLAPNLVEPLVKFQQSDGVGDNLKRLFRAADLGISEIRVVAEHAEAASDPKFQEWYRSLLSSASKTTDQPISFTQREARNVQFVHYSEAGDVPFEVEEESRGTIVFLQLISRTIRTVLAGGLLLVDELDSSLHPILCQRIVSLFQSFAKLPSPCQFIFTTHDATLLSGGLLQRDQIWLTEKDREGATHLYPLSDFRPRKQENLASGYLQGRYGAIPMINSDAFLTFAGGGNGA